MQPGTVQRLGKYRILSELGRGGTATVYLAFARGQAGVNKLVVLKALLPECAGDAEAQGRFLDEARIAAQLNHSNVVQTYEVGTEGDRSVIVMEYLEGHTLNQVVRRARLQGEQVPLEMHLQIIVNALEGLHYAHEFTGYDGVPARLVHRDVSPQNVFVTYDGQVKVLDFGIAKIASSSTQTQAGMMKGKIAYMAPEQMRGDAVDRRADIFSVGCMLWTVATGVKLWKDTPDIEVIRNVVRGEIPSPQSVNPTCDAELARIVTRAMAPERDDRYASAHELQADLQVYCAKAGAHVTTKDVGHYVSRIFTSMRMEMKAQIEREISRIVAEDPSNPSLVGAAVSSVQPVRDEAHNVPLDSLMPGPLSAKEGRARSSRRKYFAALAAVAAALLGAGFWLRERQLVPATAVVAAGIPQTAPLPAPAVTREPIDVGSGERKMVQIGFRVTPASAALIIDGQPLPAGTTSKMFRADEGVHVLRVEAPGQTPVTREFGLTRDDTLEVHLARVADRPTRPAPPPRSAPPRSSPPLAPAAKPSNEAPAKPNCDSPSFFDESGIKRFRPECL